jgi:hypothetical protein
MDNATSRHWRGVTRLTATPIGVRVLSMTLVIRSRRNSRSPLQPAEKLHCYHNMMCKRCVLSYNMWYPIRLFQQAAVGLAVKRRTKVALSD